MLGSFSSFVEKSLDSVWRDVEVGQAGNNKTSAGLEKVGPANEITQDACMQEEKMENIREIVLHFVWLKNELNSKWPNGVDGWIDIRKKK